MAKRKIELSAEEASSMGASSSSSAAVTRSDSSILHSTSPAPRDRRTAKFDAKTLEDLEDECGFLRQRYDAILTAHRELKSQYLALQSQRRDDQDRLTLVERARRSLELNAADQIRHLLDAQAVIAERDSTILQLSHRTVKFGHFQFKGLWLPNLEYIYHKMRRQPTAILNAVRTKNIGKEAPTDRVPSAAYAKITQAPRPSGATRAATGGGEESLTKLVVNRLPPSIAGRLLAQWTLRRARAAARGGRWGEAAAMYQAVLTIRDAPNLQRQLGHVLREQGRFAAAAGAYRQAIAADPNDGENHFMLGLSEAKQGNAVAARAAYARALALTPTLAEKYSELRDFASRG